MRRNSLCLMLLFVVMAIGCDDGELVQLQRDVKDLQSRVTTLETWCNTANTQICALQGLVTALEQKDFVTGVTPIVENSKEVGYTISFSKSGPITIRHGEKGVDGEKGTDGITPVIGVKQDTDGNYYWTVKTGDAAPDWMLDASGNKISTTGADGHSPVISIAEFEECFYWKIDGEWLLDNGKKVPVTGEQGDAIFAENGIDYTTDSANVIFTLADGTTKITLPKSSFVTVGFDSYEIFYASATNNEITLTLPSTLKEEDYTTLAATVTNESGTGMDVQTRSAATQEVWGVQITKPSFAGGAVVAGSAKVTLTAPADIKLSATALLKVTITDKNGKEFTVARPVKYFDGVIAESTAGNLSTVVTDGSVRKLAIKGSMSADDFAYIKQSLNALEVLDLSMTDLTVMPNRGLAFYDPQPVNTTLKRVVLPATVTAIEEAAFANCRALETIDTENARSIGKWVFENCVSLRNLRIGEKMETIYDSAFMNCTALGTINIPGSVQTLGRWLFEGCENLETITLNEGVRNLSPSTFYGCGIRSISIPSTVTEIPDWTFQECHNLEHITLHDRITSIGESVFLRCYSLKDFRIPKGVTVIRNNTFDSCQSLQRVTFHNGITEIQERAFGYCINLAGDPVGGYLTLPSSLTTLDNGAFQSCNSLLAVDMSETAVTAIPEYLFAHCEKLSAITLPNNLQSIGEWAFTLCPMASIALPASVTSVGNYAFWQCAQLKYVYSNAPTAPTIGAQTFDPECKTGRTAYIPSTANYASWSSYFDSIRNL